MMAQRQSWGNCLAYAEVRVGPCYCVGDHCGGCGEHMCECWHCAVGVCDVSGSDGGVLCSRGVRCIPAHQLGQVSKVRSSVLGSFVCSARLADAPRFLLQASACILLYSADMHTRRMERKEALLSGA